MKTFELDDNTVVKLGVNANENWQLVDSDPTFWWFHLNSYPSGHVIIETEDLTKEMIIFAAKLCKENTKYRNLKRLKICYTQCGNLTKGSKPGSVSYNSNRKVQHIVI